MKDNKEIRKAQEELEYLTGDEEEKRLAELREKAIRDEVTNMVGEREEGIQQGEKLGLEKGEKNKAIEIAKRLKQMELKIQDIQKATGLTKEEIEKL